MSEVALSEEEAKIRHLSNVPRRVVVVTGASEGLGAAAVRRLAVDGWQVVLVGRSAAKTAAVAEPLAAEWHVADFADLAQVRALALVLATNHSRIDVLVNNAGALIGRREDTIDGFEKTFQTNHLAPFLLTALLSKILLQSRGAVVNTSCGAAAYGLLNQLEPLNLTGQLRFNGDDSLDLARPRNYSSWQAYASSKLANVLHVAGLHKRLHHRGVRAAACNPGLLRTSLALGGTLPMRLTRKSLGGIALQAPDIGAARLAWLVNELAASRAESGQYYERNAAAFISPKMESIELGDRLWWYSARLVGLEC